MTRPARLATATTPTCRLPADAPAAGAATVRPTSARAPPTPGRHPPGRAPRARTTSACREPAPTAAPAPPRLRRDRSSTRTPSRRHPARPRLSCWSCRAWPTGAGCRRMRIHAAPSPRARQPMPPGWRPRHRPHIHARTHAPAHKPGRYPASRSCHPGFAPPPPMRSHPADAGSPTPAIACGARGQPRPPRARPASGMPDPLRWAYTRHARVEPSGRRGRSVRRRAPGPCVQAPSGPPTYSESASDGGSPCPAPRPGAWLRPAW
ncbi:hypothetical protein D3C72_1234030 [compost metagenome]